MGKTIYRICLVVFLIAVVILGVTIYNRYDIREEQEEWLLV